MAKKVKPQKPRKGWIYFVDPQVLVLRCPQGHERQYNLSHPEVRQCDHFECGLTMTRDSLVFKGEHPYLVWIGDNAVPAGVIQAIPMTSQSTYAGLPTSLEVSPNGQNGLDKNGLILVHQITCLDERCFKEPDGLWKQRAGILNPKMCQDVQNRIDFHFGVEREDWFLSSPNEAALEAFRHIPPAERGELIELLIEQLEEED